MRLRYFRIGFLLVVLGIYLFRLQSVSQLEIPENKLVTIRAKVTQQPYLKGSYQIISLGAVSLKTDRFPTYFYGDLLKVSGKFKKQVINPFQTQYYASFPSIHKDEEEKGIGSFRRSLYLFRSRLEKVIDQVFPEPQSSLMNGILLGSKKAMPEEFLESLRNTGTLHIVVASGYNLSVVAGFLVSALVLFVSRRKALVIAFLGVIIYTLMAGAEPPVVRAAIMAILAYGAEYLGRLRDGLIALVGSVIIMLLISPLLLFDLSFQLSFLATTGILLIYPLFKEKKIFRFPVFGDELAITLAAQIGVTPIILLNFDQLSFLSPLINALVLPLIPLLMNLGAIIVFLGFFIKPAAQLLAWLLWLPLTYFTRLIEGFGELSWISWQIKGLSWWWGAGYYFVLGIVLWRVWRKRWRLNQKLF